MKSNVWKRSKTKKPLKVTLLEIDDRELPAFSVDKQKGYAWHVVLWHFN
jgi:hypothetical protein